MQKLPVHSDDIVATADAYRIQVMVHSMRLSGSNTRACTDIGK